MAEFNEKYSCGSDDITFCQDSLNKQCDKIQKLLRFQVKAPKRLGRASW